MAQQQGDGGGRHLTDAEVDALREGRTLGADTSRHLDACGVCQQIVESLRTFDPEEGVERMLARMPAWTQPRRPTWRLAVGGVAAAVAVAAVGWGLALRARASEQALGLIQAEAAASEASLVGLRARNDAFLTTMKSVHGELAAASAGSPEDMRKAIQRALEGLDGALELSQDEHQPVIKVSAGPAGQVRVTTNGPTPTIQTLDTKKSAPFVASLVHDKASAGGMKLLSFAPEVGNELLCELVSLARGGSPEGPENLMMAFTPSPRLGAEDDEAPGLKAAPAQ